jgi:uncharacterized protein
MQDAPMAGASFPLEPLLDAVRDRSTGLRSPIHGDLHWRTVGRNGLWIAESHAGVDRTVVFLFALLHDSMRENDGYDPEHGPRAAALAEDLHAERVLRVTSTQLELLTFACEEHTNGLVSHDPTVGACWDADRLDLPRVGVTPNPDLFSTPIARDGAPPTHPPPGWEGLYVLARDSAPT